MDLLTRVEAAFGAAYEIERELPGGGMSRLFVATDRELQRKVVIKILPPELTSDMMTARFRRESEVTARLQHPHILPVISAGMREGLLYYVMPFIEGESLRHRLEREGSLPVRDALKLLWEVADALAYAHRLGVVHRDIKPENILIQDGHAVLADFGIAAALAGPEGESVAERLTRTGMSVGTVGYMSPEQSFGERSLDGRSDIYVLGVVAHEMFAGSPPFTGTSAQAVMTAHITDEPPRLDDIRDDVPDAVVKAISRALRKSPDDRFQTAAELRDALDAPEMTRVDFTRAFKLRRLRKHRRPIAIVVPAVLLAVAGGIWGWREWRARSGPVEYVTIAVAPFNDALGDSEGFWREGLVDVLARNLDGVGPLRSVSPAIAIRDFPRRATLEAARALATRTRAQYAVFGGVSGFGGENAIRLDASLVNMATGEVTRVEITRAASVEAAADSATLRLFELLGKNHRIRAVRRAPMGSSSIAALRAFLQGEQFYRRTSWDSASAAYHRAIISDTGFALALRRTAQVEAWRRGGSDSIPQAYWLRAGTHNRGLAPRDSFLVSIDSMRAGIAGMEVDALDWGLVRRLFRTVDDAAVRYPDDPEVWYAVGEARFHAGYGSVARTTERSVLDAFERVIALDSAFAPAYVHAIELAFTLDGEAKGRRYVQKYLSHDPAEKEAEGPRLLVKILAMPGRTGAQVDAIAETASPHAVYAAWLPIRRWSDSTEVALRLLRSLERRPASALPPGADSVQLRRYLAQELAYYGRLRESYLVQGTLPSRLVPLLALFGTIPPDSAAEIFRQWSTARIPQAFYFMPWLAQRRDTLSLQQLAAQARAALDSGTRGQRRTARYNAAAADAYLSLGRRDSAAALSRLLALPDTSCLGCYMERWTAAQLLAARGRHAEAARLLSERLYVFLPPVEMWMLADYASAAVRLGMRREAVQSYERVIRVWDRGDPELHPAVQRAKRALTQLSAR